MSDQSTHKSYRTHIRDEFGRFAAPTFNFDQLPVEVQEMIIIKAAVTRRLTSDTFGDVFEALAPVCKLWLDLLKTPVVYEKVKQETYLRDPMCRYLQTAQALRVIGVGRNVFSGVTLGDRLYVVERAKVVDFTTLANMSQIFVYDLDTSAVRHEKSTKRSISCIYRQPLVVLGLNASYFICKLVPCPRTNTLYVLECSLHTYMDWAVHKVKPDGTVLLRWEPHLQAIRMIFMSLSLSGAYMVMTGRQYNPSVTVWIYSTSTGALVNRLDTTAELGSYIFSNGAFLPSTLPDDCLQDIAKLSALKRYDDHNVAFDDHILLLLSYSGCMLVDTRTDRRRRLAIENTTRGSTALSCSWYDKARGLLFYPLGSGLGALRITY